MAGEQESRNEGEGRRARGGAEGRGEVAQSVSIARVPSTRRFIIAFKFPFHLLVPSLIGIARSSRMAKYQSHSSALQMIAASVSRNMETRTRTRENNLEQTER